MDISEGRSEDSAGMAHESNARLQWPRAARVPQGLIWRSGDGQTSAIEVLEKRRQVHITLVWPRSV